MRAAERLRGLDRRAETYGKRFQGQYDTEPPVWLRYAWLLVLLGPLMLPLSIIAGQEGKPLLPLVVLLVVLVAYCAAAFRWRAKHRV